MVSLILTSHSPIRTKTFFIRLCGNLSSQCGVANATTIHMKAHIVNRSEQVAINRLALFIAILAFCCYFSNTEVMTEVDIKGRQPFKYT